MQFSMNDEATVTLTAQGARIWREYWARYTHLGPDCVASAKMFAVEGDTITKELWYLFMVFGSHISHSCEIPFVGNQIEIGARSEISKALRVLLEAMDE
jgi:hypothetical protein